MSCRSLPKRSPWPSPTVGGETGMGELAGREWPGRAWGADFARRIRSESFRVHSVFHSVCNLQAASAPAEAAVQPGPAGPARPASRSSPVDWPKPLLSLVARPEAMGPNALWVDGLCFTDHFRAGWPVIFHTQALHCGAVKIDCAKASSWRTAALNVSREAAGHRSLREVQSWFETQVPGPAAGRGGPDGLARRIVRGLLEEDAPLLQSALRGLVGAGQGLTPSGDDFVAGVLSSYVRGRRRAGVKSSFVSRLPVFIEAVWSRTNAISQTMLWYAARGEGAAYLTETADAIYAGSPMAVSYASRLCRVGASSGRYLLTGVLLGCETFWTWEQSHRAGAGNKAFGAGNKIRHEKQNSGSNQNGREDRG